MKYADLVEVYSELESTSKRLEKTHIISEFLKKTSEKDLPEVVLLLQGRVFPSYDERKIGVAARLMIKVIGKSTGMTEQEIEAEWKKTGDLGITAENLVSKKKQRTLFSTSLTSSKVFENIRKLPEFVGSGTVDKKVQLISELLTSAKPGEAKFITRTVLEELRVGVADGTLRDAIVWAFFGKDLGFTYDQKENNFEVENREHYNQYIDALQSAYNAKNDFSEVILIAKEGIEALKKVKMEVGKPIKVMLYPKAKDMEDAFETVGKPAAFEYKYDGFRMQIHRKDGKTKLFTRRLDNVTKQFPDVVEVVENIKGDNFILDTEIIGIDPKTKKWKPFQDISQRIKRKYDIEEIIKKLPVMVNVFDVIEFEDQDVINKPFKERRKIIEKIIKEVPDKLQAAKQIITDDPKKAQAFYAEALKKGNEGVMAKNLEGIYKPGSRVGYGVKIKPVMETLDLVIIGAEWGEGKRANWLSSFDIACLDPDTGEYVGIGKVGTGIKELEGLGATFKELTNILKPLIIAEKGKHVTVKPKLVIEINYEEIQKSPTYQSGFALRFPRLVEVREDRRPDEISTIDVVENLYRMQRHR
ncbi:ATP-dependent DNA ligase [Nanoarchaeota archaeon]